MFYKIIKILIAGFFAILLSTAAALAESSIADVSQTMNKAGFTEEQALQVESSLKFARQNNLPADVIVDKLQEGIAKNIAPERIVRAIERIASRYSHAHLLAGNLVEDKQKAAPLGNIMASGMAAGLTTQDAEKITADFKEKYPHKTKNYSLVKEMMLTVRDLVRRGVTSATAVDVVEVALQKGLNVNEMRAIRESFNQPGAKNSIKSFAKEGMSANSQSPATAKGGVSGMGSAAGLGGGAGHSSGGSEAGGGIGGNSGMGGDSGGGGPGSEHF